MMPIRRPPDSAPLTADTLQDLLDGRLAGDAAERLREDLRASPAKAALMAALEAQQARLRAGAGDPFNEPLPTRMLEILARLKP